MNEPDREGMISPGDVPWFPKENFDGYLWGKESCVWISLIESKNPGQGNLSRLFSTILSQGRTIKVPTPFAHMETILRHKGFIREDEETIHGPCETWIKKP